MRSAKVKLPQTYLITNQINGKVYVGKTDNFKRRKKAHKDSAIYPSCGEYNSPLHRAIRKYGWNNFVMEPFAYYNTCEEANEAEIFWIAEMRSYLGRDQVYNIADGGGGATGCVWSNERTQKFSKEMSGTNNPFFGKSHTEETKPLCASYGMLGKKHTDESKRSMSIGRSGKVRSDEWRQQQREFMLSDANPLSKGKPRSPEHGAAISAAKKGKPQKPLPITKEQLDDLI